MTPYEILGVRPEDSQTVIKARYLALVRKYHPDRNPGNKKAEEYLKEVNRAYDIVSKRKPDKPDKPPASPVDATPLIWSVDLVDIYRSKSLLLSYRDRLYAHQMWSYYVEGQKIGYLDNHPLKISIRKHPLFVRKGSDLLTVRTFKEKDARKGKTLKITNIDNQILEVKLDHHLKNDEVLVIPRYGFYNPILKKIGNLRVKVTIIPTPKLVDRLKDIFK